MRKKMRDLLAEKEQFESAAAQFADELLDAQERHARATRHVGEAKREAAELRAREDARLTAEALARRNEARAAEEAQRIKKLKRLSEGELHLEEAIDMSYRHSADGVQLVVAFPIDGNEREAVRIWERRGQAKPGEYRMEAWQSRAATALGKLFAGQHVPHFGALDRW